MEHSEQMLADGSMTYGMLLDKIREQAREAILILQKNSFDTAKIEEVFNLSWANNLQGEMRDKLLQSLTYICEHIAPSLLMTTLEQENTLNALNGKYIDLVPAVRLQAAALICCLRDAIFTVSTTLYQRSLPGKSVSRWQRMLSADLSKKKDVIRKASV